MAGRGVPSRPDRASQAVPARPDGSRAVTAARSAAVAGSPSKATDSVPCRSVRQTVAPLAWRRSRSDGAGCP